MNFVKVAVTIWDNSFFCSACFADVSTWKRNLEKIFQKDGEFKGNNGTCSVLVSRHLFPTDYQLTIAVINKNGGFGFNLFPYSTVVSELRKLQLNQIYRSSVKNSAHQVEVIEIFQKSKNEIAVKIENNSQVGPLSTETCSVKIK